MKRKAMTRRQLLARSAAATAVVSASPAWAASMALGPTVLSGSLVRVELPTVGVLRGSSGGVVTFELENGAVLERGDEVVDDLGKFLPDEDVVLEGAWRDGTFAATSVKSLFHRIQGRVVRDEGRTLIVESVGPIAVAAHVRDRDGVPPEAAGRLCDGQLWRDPSRGSPVATRLRVVT